MFEYKDTIEETFSDEVGILLLEINKYNSMTKEKRNLLNKVVELMDANDYISFLGQSQNYFISRVGESYLYDVPSNKNGNLKVFRGKRIRVVCVGSGTRFDRSYMAGVVSKW